MIVRSRQFANLIGEIENEYFDVKSQPYYFDSSERAKRELAKDVAAFANSSGGFIFLGFKTKVSMSHPGEEVGEISPFLRAQVDVDRYSKLLNEWLYPEPLGIKVEWFSHGEDPEKGVVAITVPSQEERHKPYLIKRDVVDGKGSETLLGYVQRRGDRTSIRSIVEIHQALRTGFSYEEAILGRFENLESLIKRHFSVNADAEDAEKRTQDTQRRIEFALEHAELGKQRCLFLAATPSQNGELKSIFSDKPGSIKNKLENPFQFRSSGWGIRTLDQAKFLRGELIRVANGERKVVDLYRDGCLVFAGSANKEFIAWNNNIDLQIHPLALIEVIASFVRFYKDVLADFHADAGKITFRIGLRNMKLAGKISFLPARKDYATPLYPTGPAKTAPGDCWVKDIATSDAYDPDRVAFELVRELYVWFGQTEDVIPYTTEKYDQVVIDADQLESIP